MITILQMRSLRILREEGHEFKKIELLIQELVLTHNLQNKCEDLCLKLHF